MDAAESLFDSRPLPVIDEALIASVAQALAIQNSSPYQPAPTGQVVAFLRQYLGKKAFATIW